MFAIELQISASGDKPWTSQETAKSEFYQLRCILCDGFCAMDFTSDGCKIVLALIALHGRVLTFLSKCSLI